MPPNPPTNPPATPLQCCRVGLATTAIWRLRHPPSTQGRIRPLRNQPGIAAGIFDESAASAPEPAAQKDGGGRGGLGDDQRRRERIALEGRRRRPPIGPKIIKTALHQQPEGAPWQTKRFRDRLGMEKKARPSAAAEGGGKVVHLPPSLA
jgi:hypothetical protein